MPFSSFIDGVLAQEGGYSDNPNDNGGPTNWGITQAVARANGYSADMQAMTRDQAVTIFQQEYWALLNLDQVDVLYTNLAGDIFELAVNMGPGTAGKFLQIAINCARFGSYDTAIGQDGEIGHGTITALRAIYEHRGVEGMQVVRGMVLSQACMHYMQIMQANPSQAQFEYGWVRGRIVGAP